MTQAFEQMLQLVALGAAGNQVTLDSSDVDWAQVIKVAETQKVHCFLARALKGQPDLSCPDAIRDPLIREGRKLSVSNALHRSAIVQLLEAMEAAGIHAVLLKGYAVAGCYAAPECRLCGDADIWVDPKDEERACAFLKEQGFTVNPRWTNGHHAVCHHPLMGCVELHVILYDEIVEDVWFSKMDGSEFVTEPHRVVASEDGQYYTLGHTDHLIFLMLHMIKHFILSGLTVQMMLDVALYFRKHADTVNVDRVWQTINSLHYGKLLNSILWAMVRYCGFHRDDFPGLCTEAPEQLEAILDDLEIGGWMGFADRTARREGWQEYNRQMMLKSRSKLAYYLHMAGWKLGLFRTALFPPAQKLQRDYPYARRHSVLLPLAWLQRLLFRGSRAVKRGALTDGIVVNQENLSTSAKARVALFKDLEMM